MRKKLLNEICLVDEQPFQQTLFADEGCVMGG